MINLDSKEFKKFLEELKKILNDEIKETSIEDLAASREEIIERITKELGEEKIKELSFVATNMDKADWPEQKVDSLTSLTVKKQ